MIANTVSLLVLVIIAVGESQSSPAPTITARTLAGVDPNTLKCDPKGQEFLLLPHFTNCDMFYMCANGEEVEFSCAPGGLVFDFEQQTCNWAWAVECTLRTSPEEEETASVEDGEDIEESGSGESSGDLDWVESYTAESVVDPIANLMGAIRAEQASPQAEFPNILDCSNPLVSSRQVAYKSDCQRFWRCVDGLPHTAYCSDGLFFNEKTMQCDFEANAGCAINHDEELNGEFIVYK